MHTERGPRLTVVSRTFPPRAAGSAILLANLLSVYTGAVQAIAGEDQYSPPDPAFLPPCPTRSLALPFRSPRIYDAVRLRNQAVASRLIQGMMRRTLAAMNTDVVFAAFPREDFFVAAFLAARRLRLPFYAHMHDLWQENMPDGQAARFAAAWEPRILQQATRVLCMTEAMQKHYETKYGIQTELLPHSIPEQDYLRAPREIVPPRMAKPTMLFVGAVSPAMNLDALRVLAAASELLPPDYELLFCTATDRTELQCLGIRSSRLRVTYVSRAEVQRLQSEAHVLVAPLSHKDCSLDEVRTVFSTKLLEYLIAGRPIVVFAPAESHHATSALQHGWGYVVTEDSPAALATALVKVATDEHLAAELVRRALQEARSRDARHYAERLREWVLKDARQA